MQDTKQRLHFPRHLIHIYTVAKSCQNASVRLKIRYLLVRCRKKAWFCKTFIIFHKHYMNVNQVPRNVVHWDRFLHSIFGPGVINLAYLAIIACSVAKHWVTEINEAFRNTHTPVFCVIRCCHKLGQGIFKTENQIKKNFYRKMLICL